MGSFECSCKKGYKLLINERNCQGKGLWDSGTLPGDNTFPCLPTAAGGVMALLLLFALPRTMFTVRVISAGLRFCSEP